MSANPEIQAIFDQLDKEAAQERDLSVNTSRRRENAGMARLLLEITIELAVSADNRLTRAVREARGSLMITPSGQAYLA